jgi:hypothetical protein
MTYDVARAHQEESQKLPSPVPDIGEYLRASAANSANLVPLNGATHD